MSVCKSVWYYVRPLICPSACLYDITYYTFAFLFPYNRFDVLECGDIQRLVKKRKRESGLILYYVCAKEMYSIIQKAHIATGHGGRDKMLKELSKRYANITREVVGLYKEFCEECQLKKRKIASKGLVVRPLISKDFNSRGQVDLVDMQSLKHGEYKYILHYQDHLTKYSVLRAITSKRAAEVAYHLLDIFLLFGAPHILQSDNGREFTASVISELKDLWPDCVVVHGKPRHPQSQGSVERANADIKDMLITWMRENPNQSWTIGLKFVQFAKNNSYHSGIKRSPYKALFGVDAKMGLTSTALPPEILSSLQSEDDLIQHMELSQSSSQSSECSSSQSEADWDSGSQTSDDEIMTSGNFNRDCAIEIHAETRSTATFCSICNKETDGAHNCQQCKSIIHRACGSLCESEASGSQLLCTLCKSTECINTERMSAATAIMTQSERMLDSTNKVLHDVDEGTNVLIPIPQVDRGKADPKNVLAMVVSKSENGYRLAVKQGLLIGSYTRNQFELADRAFLTPLSICTDNELSLRRAVKEGSVCEGQGYSRCGCSTTSRLRCNTKRCLCKKSGQLCNSRCHPNLTCKNN